MLAAFAALKVAKFEDSSDIGGILPVPTAHKTLEAKVGIEPAYTALQAAA